MASVDNKEAVLGEEDLVTVSYMAEELDLETVGDIIAIIEEKVNQTCTFIILFFLIIKCIFLMSTYIFFCASVLFFNIRYLIFHVIW